MPELELDDIQGLIARGYPDLKAATYVLVQIDDAARARQWLGSCRRGHPRHGATLRLRIELSRHCHGLAEARPA